MPVELTGPEIDAFLAGPLVATLATYRRDGTVLLSPVWQEWRDGCFYLVVSHGDVKVTHVRARPQAGIVVAEHWTPYRGVEARGTAELLDEGYPELAERIVQRYLAGVSRRSSTGTATCSGSAGAAEGLVVLGLVRSGCRARSSGRRRPRGRRPTTLPAPPAPRR